MYASENNLGSRPIGAIKALATGFDRVAALPILILPSVVLDLFLWFGPHLVIPSIIQFISTGLTPPASVDPVVVEQLALFKDSFLELASRYNLFTALSTLPAGLPFNLIFGLIASLSVGVPSLIAIVLPTATPLGVTAQVQISQDASTLWIWLGISLLGMALGAVYLREIARGYAAEVKEIPFWKTFKRLLFMAILGYVVSGAVLLGSMLIGSIDALLYLGMPILFVGAVYLSFTSHGIILFGLGLRQAMRESLRIVRWNFFSSMGFLLSVFLIAWIGATQVWSLPDEGSWYLLLAIVGHAFVSTTLLSASYAYYQSRRAWMLGLAEEITKRQQAAVKQNDDSGNIQLIRRTQRG